MPSPIEARRAEDLPLLDPALGLRLLPSEAAYKRVLELFARTHATDEDLLRAHLAAGETRAIAELSHKLRGSAAPLALQRLAFVAGELEQAIRGGAELGELPRTFAEALRATRAEVLAYLGPAAVAAPAPPSAPLDEARAKRCIDLADKLLVALDDADPDAAEPLLAQLGQAVTDAELRPIRELVEEFDFLRAIDATRALRQRLAAHLGG